MSLWMLFSCDEYIPYHFQILIIHSHKICQSLIARKYSLIHKHICLHRSIKISRKYSLIYKHICLHRSIEDVMRVILLDVNWEDNRRIHIFIYSEVVSMVKLGMHFIL